MQKELNEALEMLVVATNLVLTSKVADNSGKIQWQDGYTDYLLKGIHKGCKKTKQPEHYSINSEEEDDPMDGLTSGIRDLGNDDDDDDDDDENGGGKPLPEKKKPRGRPPSKKTDEKDKSN